MFVCVRIKLIADFFSLFTFLPWKWEENKILGEIDKAKKVMNEFWGFKGIFKLFNGKLKFKK